MNKDCKANLSIPRTAFFRKKNSVSCPSPVHVSSQLSYWTVLPDSLAYLEHVTTATVAVLTNCFDKFNLMFKIALI